MSQTMTITAERDRLTHLREKRSAIIEAMETVSSRLTAQLAEELPARWDEIVQLFISNRPEEVTARGLQGLTRLKQDLDQLRSESHQIAKNHLRGPAVWRHLLTDPGASFEVVRLSRHEGRRSCLVTGPIRHAEEEVLAFLEPVFGSCDRPWLQSKLGKTSAPLERMTEAYDRLGNQLDEVESELSTLNRHLLVEEARRLWDEA